jgi:hypothetical protein
MLHINGKLTMGNFPHCQLRGVGQSMKRAYLYLLYPLFSTQWDICDQRNHQT